MIYKLFVLLILFGGGFLLLRYGLGMSQQLSWMIAFVGMPAVTFAVWLLGYKGKKFK